ncbi:DUF1640-domain-containing protein [Hortaea werneckii]|uniref:DUF1640 domain-containing protein n=1 Tax=Hortaea werneckii TaxID=91943 RepID=A0A3M7FDC6_HORWE|nr:DUF1640-domain-containing protein [Hortaea werneckii]RMY86853.1 hypothetical protein D0861_05698 [Hortaea werneckii]
MTTPLASNTIRSAHRCLSAGNPIRPAYTSSLSTTPHQPFHTRTTATTAFAQAQWNHRRRTPSRPSPLIQPHPNRQPPLRNQPFTTTRPRPKDHHFDTLKFVQRLEAEGFTEAQSAAMMRVLSDVIEESIQNLTRTMVLREDQEKATYTQKVDFAKLRSELLSADSSESSLTRGTHERLTNDLAKLNSRLRDEVQRTQASVRLDLNLEKGRIREEANSQDLKIKETETRIEQECAALRERLEAVKFSTLQWLMGVCTGTAAIILGVWRLLM